MKKIILSFLALSFFLTMVSADFEGGVVYNSTMETNPAMAISPDGITHLFWSTGPEVLHATSEDNFETFETLMSNSDQYRYPSATFDEDGNWHLVVLEHQTTGVYPFKTLYLNSIDHVIKDTGVVGFETETDIKISPTDGGLYISTVKNYPGYYSDVVILHSTDFETFSLTRIPKENLQMDAKLGINSKGVVHLVYYDWSDGVSGGVGQYKVRYRNSLDNYASDEQISPAQQSYSADLDIDSDDTVWISYKDTTQTVSGGQFDNGIIWLTKKTPNRGWEREQVTPMIKYGQGRSTGLSISEDDVKHISWTDLTYEPPLNPLMSAEDEPTWMVNVNYANSEDLTNVEITDIGDNPGIGYVEIDSDHNIPQIAANIHSLAFYTQSTDGGGVESKHPDLFEKHDPINTFICSRYL